MWERERGKREGQREREIGERKRAGEKGRQSYRCKKKVLKN